MNREQNLTNKQKDLKIKELEVEISLLRQRLDMINNISGLVLASTTSSHNTNENEKVVENKECSKCRKVKTDDKRSNWFNKYGLLFCEPCFKIECPETYSHWQEKHVNPFFPLHSSKYEKEMNEKKDNESLAEHIKK